MSEPWYIGRKGEFGTRDRALFVATSLLILRDVEMGLVTETECRHSPMVAHLQ